MSRIEATMRSLNELIIPLQAKLANSELNFNLPTILQRTALLLATWYLVSVFRQWWRLRHIPGPFINSITPLAYTYHTLKNDLTTYTYNLTRKYGPLVRISPNVVVFSDPQTFRHICSPKSGYSKGLWFEFLRWDLEHHSVITIRDDATRKERKAKLTPAWQSGTIAKMEKRVDAVVRSFIDLVERKYTSTPGNLRPMDFGERSIMFTLDVATSVTFGETWGCLQKDSDVNKYIESSESVLDMFGVLSSMPWLVYVTHAWPFNLMMPGEEDSVGFGKLMKFSTDQVKLRAKSSADTDKLASEHDLIGSYLKNGVDPIDVAQECNSLIVAGTETTSVALKMTLLCLLTTPPSYQKAQAEIDAYYTSRPNLQTDPTSIIPYTDAKSLPYIQACIREALRLWPPAAGLFTKQVPDNGGDTLHGYYLPPGTEIGQSMMGVGRDPTLFGVTEDAQIFRPERWFEAEPQRFEHMVSAVELVFSNAKYVCQGKPIALMELAKFFVEVLRRYDIAIVNNIQPLTMRDPIMWLAKDFNIRFNKREVK